MNLGRKCLELALIIKLFYDLYIIIHDLNNIIIQMNIISVDIAVYLFCLEQEYGNGNPFIIKNMHSSAVFYILYIAGIFLSHIVGGKAQLLLIGSSPKEGGANRESIADFRMARDKPEALTLFPSYPFHSSFLVFQPFLKWG